MGGDEDGGNNGSGSGTGDGGGVSAPAEGGVSDPTAWKKGRNRLGKGGYRRPGAALGHLTEAEISLALLMETCRKSGAWRALALTSKKMGLVEKAKEIWHWYYMAEERAKELKAEVTAAIVGTALRKASASAAKSQAMDGKRVLMKRSKRTGRFTKLKPKYDPNHKDETE